jgi:hypothetical protein
MPFADAKADLMDEINRWPSGRGENDKTGR